MITDIIRNTGLFIFLLMLQILLMDNIQFSGYINPYIYILFIILLPVEIPAWLLLILSFLAGLAVDLFNGTLGLHASATTFAGFARPYVLRILAPRDGYDTGVLPVPGNYGWRWFLAYVTLIVTIHHFALFYTEVFRLTNFFSTLLRVMLSSLFSIGFILIIKLVIVKR